MILLKISDRTIEEVYQSELEWQFWTKIVVEAIGCVGAGILVYVWGKSYFSIISKWVAFNRTFIIISSSPPPIKKPIPNSQPSQDSNFKTSKRPVTTTLTPPNLALNPNQDSSVVVVPGGSSSPLLVEGGGVGMGGGFGTVCSCGGGDAHDSSSDIEPTSNDKSKEAKALLLPPVVYNPPLD